jgi:hypothetical protein
MPAHPKLDGDVSTPFTGARKALVTEECSPLEPGVLDRKLDVRGMGLAEERSAKRGRDHPVLVAVRP